jgi:hypothetical protein
MQPKTIDSVTRPRMPKLMPNLIVSACAESVAESITFNSAEGKKNHIQLS